jgi:DNA-binding beta-propeller fold protein YncE
VGPDGDVYVSDSGNERVEVFSPTGAFIRRFGGPAGPKGGFLLPFDLVVDPQRDVYVTDDQLNVVEKYSPTGAFVWQVGGPGTTDPDLVGQFHLESVDRHGLIVTTSSLQDGIVYLNSRAEGRRLPDNRRFTSGGRPLRRVARSAW